VTGLASPCEGSPEWRTLTTFDITVFPEAFMISLQRLSKREDGQDLLEYGLLASLIAIFALAAVQLVATEITDTFWGAIAALNF
jgi:Flp pilus assembly pilin Flp